MGDVVLYNDVYALVINSDKSANTITLDKTLSAEALYSVEVKVNTTVASGEASHAEGAGAAFGRYSHAENSSRALGNMSHAEGYKTVANAECQHVQGKCNLIDSSNKYAHIVGNGESEAQRSNAHTVDWDGNAWFAGTMEGDGIILPDTETGKKYKLTVANGKLTMEEVV